MSEEWRGCMNKLVCSINRGFRRLVVSAGLKSDFKVWDLRGVQD